MLEQMMLREKFQDLLDRQQQALGCYESALGQCDEEARAHLDQLCRDKKRHIELTRRMLEIVE
jgi:hypothetical protein